MTGVAVQLEVALVVPAGRMAAAQQGLASAQAAAPAAVLQCCRAWLRLTA